MIISDCVNDTMCDAMRDPEFQQRLHQEPQVWCATGLNLFGFLKLSDNCKNSTPSKL